MQSLRVLFLRAALMATVLPLLVLTVILLRDQEAAGSAALDRSLQVAARLALGGLATVPDAQLQAATLRLSPTEGENTLPEVRLTVIAEDGWVLADNEADPTGMVNHANRPEVRQALARGSGQAERQSDTRRMPMRYFAVAHREPNGVRIYRVAAPLAPLRETIQQTQLSLAVTATLILGLALFFSLRLGQQIVGPLEALSSMAARFTAGDRDAHVLPPDGPLALRRLGETFNSMVERINHQVRSLDEAQGYLDTVIRQMPEGLLVVDARGTVKRVNAVAEELLGVSAERLVGRPILASFLSYELDRAIHRVLASQREIGSPPTASDSQQNGPPRDSVELRTPDGRTLRVSLGPLELAGIPAGAVAILQDVSELRRVEAMRRDFVANVSHELRTPIAAIRALAETLELRGARRPGLIGEYAPRMVTECERIDRLVSDLLLLAQTEAGHLRLQPEPLDTQDLADEIARLVEPLAEAAGATVELENFTDASALADRFAAGQCVRNLVDNALRYAAGRVRVGSYLEGGQVVIYVRDDGPGIPPEDLPRIFERFYRVDKARARDDTPVSGGSGLGLSIVRHLTEVQGGRAWAESRPGAGSTFSVAFPVATQERDELPSDAG